MPLAHPAATAVVTIAQRWGAAGEVPTLRVVDHRWLQAADLPALGWALAALLGEVWRCNRVVVEASDTLPGTPVGSPIGSPAGSIETLAHLLGGALGYGAVEWAAPDPWHDSELAMGLLAAVNTGRLQAYAADGALEYRSLQHELRTARAAFTRDGRLTIRPATRGPGFLRGLLLLGAGLPPETAIGHRIAAPALAS